MNRNRFRSWVPGANTRATNQGQSDTAARFQEWSGVPSQSFPEERTGPCLPTAAVPVGLLGHGLEGERD
eukprot:CAMPEP_0194692114 /NCGR_PEP_ID=MMETSP0295-20121207/19508_1 /TAXON_ID=39354 /ORGANISM="Heterosigma akashiwo, Strain CCMP2393" /LENGTH=68 /DNA_ID=CAMNT_0039582273 /DNA_START=638 /DNA_END=841 /DNA_ORIENTATION=+